MSERYFKVIEINKKEFENKTKTSLDFYSEVSTTVKGNVFIGVNENKTDDFEVSLYQFD